MRLQCKRHRSIALRSVPAFSEMCVRGRGPFESRLGFWLERFFASHMTRVEGHPHEMLPEFYMAVGPAERGVHHAVVYSRGALVHDPHSSKSGLIEVHVKDNYSLAYSLAPKMHTGGVVPKDGIYTLQKGETAPKHNDTKDETTSDVRVPYNTREAHSGFNFPPHSSPVQADPDVDSGASESRFRKEIPTGGHKVTGGDDPDSANRKAFIESERKRKDERTKRRRARAAENRFTSLLRSRKACSSIQPS
jgi:hypothetical protein